MKPSHRQSYDWQHLIKTKRLRLADLNESKSPENPLSFAIPSRLFMDFVHEALGAERYVVTALNFRGRNRIIAVCRALGLVKYVKQIRSARESGETLFLTPVDPARTFIVVDFLLGTTLTP